VAAAAALPRTGSYGDVASGAGSSGGRAAGPGLLDERHGGEGASFLPPGSLETPTPVAAIARAAAAAGCLATVDVTGTPAMAASPVEPIAQPQSPVATGSARRDLAQA
jgi:hypothetical protein